MNLEPALSQAVHDYNIGKYESSYAKLLLVNESLASLLEYPKPKEKTTMESVQELLLFWNKNETINYKESNAIAIRGFSVNFDLELITCAYKATRLLINIGIQSHHPPVEDIAYSRYEEANDLLDLASKRLNLVLGAYLYFSEEVPTNVSILAADVSSLSLEIASRMCTIYTEPIIEDRKESYLDRSWDMRYRNY